MKLLLFLLLSASPAQASVAAVPVSQDTITKVAEVLAVRSAPQGKRTTLKVTVTPQVGTAFLFADLQLNGWTTRLQPEPLEIGEIVFTVYVDPNATGTPSLDILVDNVDPNRPAVGVLYQLSLASFLN